MVHVQSFVTIREDLSELEQSEDASQIEDQNAVTARSREKHNNVVIYTGDIGSYFHQK